MLTFAPRTCSRAAFAVLAPVVVLAVLTFRDYGITWDEELQSQYGLAIVDYYASFLQDHRFDEIFNLYLYGGMFDGLASVFDQFTPFTVYETRHLLNALCGILGLWGIWKLGRLLGGGVVGLLALVLLATTPMYYGHMFNNPKDIPFAVGIIWSLYYMGRAYAGLPRPRRATLVKLGIVYGLTLGVRVGGVMLFAFWLAPLGLSALAPLMKKSPDRKDFLDFLRRGWSLVWRVVLPVAALSYALMLICWPWAQEDPLRNPLRALGEFSNFPQDVDVLLDGVTYSSTQLPWSYVPQYFGVQMPEMLLFLTCAALLLTPWLLRGLYRPQRQIFVTMLLMALVPMLYAMIRHPALYDAVRHFLFVAPIACALAALAAVRLHDWARSEFDREISRKLVSAGLAFVFTVCVAAQILTMMKLHPYEYIYANGMAGGVKGIYGRYELDYWGSSFKEAAEGLQDYVADHGGVPPGTIYRVAICGPWSAAMIYLPPNYEAVEADQTADYFITTTRWMCQNMRPGRDIVTVRRMGVPLSVVKDLRGGYETIPK